MGSKTIDSSQAAAKKKASLGGAYLVALGILLSRLTGFVRMRALAHFLGNSEAGDAFYAAIKIPNFPQNLLGEGVLSASFIPVYANLVAKGNKEEAGKVAGVILSVLCLIVSIIVFLGIIFTPYFIDLIAPGFSGDKKSLTIQLVRVIFPGTGLLVISAWCLGILNSHHKFFLSYAAPVFSNFAVIGILFFFRHETQQNQLALYAAWGLVLGSLLQLGVQIPTTLSLLPTLKLSLSTQLDSVKTIIKNFVPVVVSRGVVQLSAYIDSILASFLPSGAVAALGYAQSVYMLPISLFGMSISAAELPVMSESYGESNFHQILQNRINSAFRKIAFFVVPSVAAFLFLGDCISGILFQSGKFDYEASIYVWKILAGSAVGLLASTLGRLYSSAFYSLRDTKTPLRFSMVRVFLTTVLGYVMGLKLPQLLGVDSSWGTAGLTASAGIAGWIEFLLLRHKLNKLIGTTGIPLSLTLKLWVCSITSGLCALLAKTYLNFFSSAFFDGLVVVSLFSIIYFITSLLFNISESKQILSKVLRLK